MVHVRFKEEVFYSLCYATPRDSAVVMTYSNGACGRLEFWTLPDTYPPRTLVVAPAWFAHYRPRRGLANTLDALADVSDTMVAMYLPAPFAASLRYKEDKLDCSATISAWLSGDERRIVSFSCYTGELEADICQAAQAAGSDRQESLAGAHCGVLQPAVADYGALQPAVAACTSHTCF